MRSKRAILTGVPILIECSSPTFGEAGLLRHFLLLAEQGMILSPVARSSSSMKSAEK